MSSIRYKSKYDYTKEPRKQVTTTVNKELHKQLMILSANIDQPSSKLWDVLLLELFKDEDTVNEFIKKVRQY